MSSTSTTSKGNGKGTTTALLPTSIAVEVNGATVVAPGKPSKAGNFWFEASVIAALRDGVDARTALGSMVVKYDDAEVKAGDVHVSLPRVRNGKTVAGTGGNLTVTHSFSVTLGDKLFRGMVTATYVEKKGHIRLQVKAIPAPEAREPQVIGAVVGDLSF